MSFTLLSVQILIHIWVRQEWLESINVNCVSSRSMKWFEPYISWWHCKKQNKENHREKWHLWDFIYFVSLLYWWFKKGKKVEGNVVFSRDIKEITWVKKKTLTCFFFFLFRRIEHKLYFFLLVCFPFSHISQQQKNRRRCS